MEFCTSLQVKGYLRQRSPGSWELTIDTGRDALGRRQRKFVTVQGTQAQRKLRELLSILDKGLGLPAEKILLRDWLDRWMQEIIAPNRRQRTKERYQGIITRHIKPAIGHVPLTKLAPSHVQALESQLSVRGMAAEGVGLVHRVLSGAMKHALLMEMVYRNPVSVVSPPRIIRQEPAPPDIPAVRAALDLAGAEEHYLYACIHLIAYTGMRRGEAMGLLWNDVDLERGRILIERSLSRTLEQGLHVDPPKTNSGRRVVDLDAGTIEVMAKHREDQRTTKELMREMYKDHGKVFADPYGEWINPDNLSKAVKSFGQRVGHPEMTVRSLRHFHASVSLQSGQSVVIVSKRLGHASVSTTADIYAHSLPGWGFAPKVAVEPKVGHLNQKSHAGSWHILPLGSPEARGGKACTWTLLYPADAAADKRRRYVLSRPVGGADTVR